MDIEKITREPVSYTHLDVYKRQIHCCGNTNWKIILELGVDIVSFDSYSFGDKLALYPEEIKKFLQGGGFLAFGIIPTSEYRKGVSEDELYGKFISIIESFEKRGISRDLLFKNIIFTPSCGLGPVSYTHLTG